MVGLRAQPTGHKDSRHPRFASPQALTFMLALRNDSDDSDKHSHKSVYVVCRWNQGQ